MLSFARLTSFLLFVLSLSFLTCAAPTPKNSGLAVRDYGYGNDSGSYSPGDRALKIVADLAVDVRATVDVLANVNVVGDAVVQADILVGHIEHAAELILAVGTKVNVNILLQARIAAEVAAIIRVVVKALVALCAKFGVSAIVSILAKIDAAVHLLLINLDVCISGIVGVVAKLLVDVSLKLFVKANLHLCAQVLAFLG